VAEVFHSNCAEETFVQRKKISPVYVKGKIRSKRAKDSWEAQH
jgi:hypothetical protein